MTDAEYPEPVSDHFEWVLALRLLPDTPIPFLDELRYYLGLSPDPPDEPTLDYDQWDGPYQCLAADRVHALAGGEFATLTEQKPYLNHEPVWGLFVRLMVLDDGLGLTTDVLKWLAPWSLTQGWVGFVRDELELRPWLNLYVQDGHAYFSKVTADIEPTGVSDSTPPFTLVQTTDDFRRPRM